MLTEEVEHITRTTFLGPGEGARFSLSKESFLTQADIFKVKIVREKLG
jgi:hypothetical protein